MSWSPTTHDIPQYRTLLLSLVGVSGPVLRWQQVPNSLKKTCNRLFHEDNAKGWMTPQLRPQDSTIVSDTSATGEPAKTQMANPSRTQEATNMN